MDHHLTAPDASASVVHADLGAPDGPRHDPPDGSAARRLQGIYAVACGVVFGALALLASHGPIVDIDVYWHLLVGQDLLRGVPVSAAGRGWSFAPVPDTWVSTQWLAEALFARLEQWEGLPSLVWYRSVTSMAALTSLAAVTLWRRPLRAGVWIFAFAGLAIPLYAEERSQQLTFVLVPVVGWWAEQAWRHGRLPRWWVLVPLVVLWSNFHGGWVLVPMALGLAAVARTLDHGVRDETVRRALGRTLLAVASACLTPSGVGGVLAIVRFSESAGVVDEWKAVRLWDFGAFPLVAIVLVVVGAWALGRSRPCRGEVLLVLALAGFGFSAWRNVTPAALLLAPLATGILARGLGEADPRPRGEPLPAARVTAAVMVVSAVLSLALAARQDPVVRPDVPQRLMAAIAATSADQKVLDTYNIAGPLLWLGGRPPHVTVAIDGRADRYGADFITRYQSGLLGAQPGWEKLFDQLDPTAALLRNDEALSGVLVAQRHWVVVGREGDYVLLHAPDAPGWPAS